MYGRVLKIIKTWLQSGLLQSRSFGKIMDGSIRQLMSRHARFVICSLLVLLWICRSVFVFLMKGLSVSPRVVAIVVKIREIIIWTKLSQIAKLSFSFLYSRSSVCLFFPSKTNETNENVSIARLFRLITHDRYSRIGNFKWSFWMMLVMMTMMILQSRVAVNDELDENWFTRVKKRRSHCH